MKTLGDNLQLFVHDATGTTFSKPLGQGNLTINRSSDTIDTSDKNSGRYSTSAPGQKKLTITQAITPDLPDDAYTHMKTLDSSAAASVYQVRDVTKPDGSNVMFECSMYTDFGNSDAAQKGVLGTSVTLSAATAPTVDLI